MELAFLINAGRQRKTAPDAMLRPFADSSLLEIAVEKLSHLDAPCRKYVAWSDREQRQAANQFSGLTLIRRAPDSIDSGASPSAAFAHARSLPERWLFVIDPSFPLVSPDLWWDAVEHFLATQPAGIVSATRLDGRFFDDGGELFGGDDASRTLLVENDAFKIVSRDALREDRLWRAEDGWPAAYELPAIAAWGIHETEDRAAVEAVYSMSQLGLYV